VPLSPEAKNKERFRVSRISHLGDVPNSEEPNRIVSSGSEH
jgi:hypothetical protein